MPPRHIAILGGGLTGLASAFHLARRFPHARITLVEKQGRLGGWVRSERVEVGVDVPPRGGNDIGGRLAVGQGKEAKGNGLGHGKATLILEAGPRTLRPNANSVLELINLLDLRSEVIVTPKSSDAAKSRFIYLGEEHGQGRGKGREGLTRIPTTLTQLLTSPLRPLLFTSVLREFFRGANRPSPSVSSSSSSSSPLSSNKHAPSDKHHDNVKIYEDESFDAFLARRFGPAFARVLGSALVHGVYAADARKLSVRAAFPALWEAEERGWGSVGRGVLRGLVPWGKGKGKGKGAGGDKGKEKEMEKEYELGSIPELMPGAAVFSFRGGMQTLTDALERAVSGSANVDVLKGEEVRRVEVREDGELLITTRTRTLTPTHILSTLPLPTLHRLLPQSQDSPCAESTPTIPHLLANPSSTVTLVNLVFPAPPSQIHPPGFGYLVPRPDGGYPREKGVKEKEKGTLGILGVVFDSCSLGAQDSYSYSEGGGEGGEAGLTKMTVMLGGPYLSPSPSQSPSSPTNPPPPPPPSEEELNIPTLLKHIQTHLGRAQPLPEPVYVKVWHHVGCIPTLTPGHAGRMDEVRGVLRGERWEGRMEVVGAGVGGVSVGDCVEAGRRAGEGWS